MTASSSGCPGQDRRQLTVGIFKCPGCGAEVEMFSDEQRRSCPGCGETVVRDQTPSCVMWCQHAKSCLGDERYAALMSVKAEPEDPVT